MLVLIATLLSIPALTAAIQSGRVAVLPFDIHSEGDLTFLQKGVVDMLSTRLAYEDQVTVVGKQQTRRALEGVPLPLTPSTALEVARNLQADYAVTGSLTVFGDSISTDTRFIEVRTGKPLVTFNQYGQSQGEVIYHVNLFAAQINEQVFGRKTMAYRPPQQQQAAVDSSHMHPEKLWNGAGGGDVIGYDALHQEHQIAHSLWKSRSFKTHIRGLSAGDVDGDGHREIVFIDDQTVFVYRKLDRRFAKIGEVPGGAQDRFIGVDVADINANGREEIFVTNVYAGDRMQSFVLEYQGGQFEKIAERENWYYRVLHIEGPGNILLGQKRGMDDLFLGDVYEMQWENGQYQPGARQTLPKKTNIYGFTYGDVFNNGSQVIAAFNASDYLQILDEAGGEEWTSSDQMGGSPNHLTYLPQMVETIGEHKEQEFYYLPQRIHVADLDGDGRKEVIVVKNEEVAGRLMSRMRAYKNGYIECRQWDQIGLTRKWRTQTVSKYISDYTVTDLNGDGRSELLFAVVSKTGQLLGQSKSYIVSWEPQQKQKDKKES